MSLDSDKKVRQIQKIGTKEIFQLYRKYAHIFDKIMEKKHTKISVCDCNLDLFYSNLLLKHVRSPKNNIQSKIKLNRII